MAARDSAAEAETARVVPQEPERPPTALVVDADSVSRRFVEIALSAQGGFVVEAALDAAGALETLSNRVVDAIVAEIDLNDMNGLQLFRRLSQERRLRSIPYIVLSSDDRPSTKVAALRAGVDDYVTKPANAAEFCARTVALVNRQRRARDQLRQRSFTLAGELSAMPLPDLVSMVEMGRRSGILSVVTADAVGQVFFDQGRIVHAVYSNVAGRDAFFRLVTECDGSFEFSPGRPALGAHELTITESATALIMEAARLLDTERASRPDGASSAASEKRRSASRSTYPPTELRPALIPEATLGGLFELALRDQFGLGELRLWTLDELARWTASESSRDRMHVNLIADLPEGVSAILSLAGAPSERWVLGSLRPEHKFFGLSFFFRHERTLDVVLIDAHDPGAVEASLKRVPSFQIVAPPDGELLSLGVKARVALERLIRRLKPPAIIGVGNASLDGALRGIARGSSGSLVRCVEGRLGDASCDLRTLLIRGLRLWTASGARHEPHAENDR